MRETDSVPSDGNRKARKREIVAETNRKQAEIFRRRLSRLKKKTRKRA